MTSSPVWFYFPEPPGEQGLFALELYKPNFAAGRVPAYRRSRGQVPDRALAVSRLSICLSRELAGSGTWGLA